MPLRAGHTSRLQGRPRLDYSVPTRRALDAYRAIPCLAVRAGRACETQQTIGTEISRRTPIAEPSTPRLARVACTFHINTLGGGKAIAIRPLAFSGFPPLAWHTRCPRLHRRIGIRVSATCLASGGTFSARESPRGALLTRTRRVGSTYRIILTRVTKQALRRPRAVLVATSGTSRAVQLHFCISISPNRTRL